ncbi:hypothetical protein LEP1GSC193_0710 [Leptospira phage vB_LalZ_80412-LE1]|uniref:Uncharacterized protein n=1 Tax=Leptospira alstonii serovar Sichuan str. 79601 TaxID=1218565 RepID=M6CUJ5_9LEPT|nr:hypothetical protein LEP1GSC193_0710 [Leptospira phage vB_LalZ_80412-LE1]EMJ95389.1 hypothetical protein LEP1GSC194_3511 [Leptospira alstonii serovar Sichuan str. 79601]
MENDVFLIQIVTLVHFASGPPFKKNEKKASKHGLCPFNKYNIYPEYN